LRPEFSLTVVDIKVLHRPDRAGGIRFARPWRRSRTKGPLSFGGGEHEASPGHRPLLVTACTPSPTEQALSDQLEREKHMTAAQMLDDQICTLLGKTTPGSVCLQHRAEERAKEEAALADARQHDPQCKAAFAALKIARPSRGTSDNGRARLQTGSHQLTGNR